MRRVLAVFSILASCAAAIGLFLGAFWIYDVHKDREHTIVVNSATPIFAGSGSERCDDSPLLVAADANTPLKVKRIRYWKNCATVDVALPDGRIGYVVHGVGDFSVSPPPLGE